MIVAPSTSLVASVRSTSTPLGFGRRARKSFSTPPLGQHNETTATRDSYKGRTTNDAARTGAVPSALIETVAASPEGVGALALRRRSLPCSRRDPSTASTEGVRWPGHRQAGRGPRARGPADPSGAAAGATRPDRRVAGVGRACGGRGVLRPRGRRALAPPGGGGRGGVRRPARRAGHRHRVGQVAGLPAAGADLGARPRGTARPARGHHALPRADQGAGPGPAGRPGRAGPGRARHHPRRRQRPRPARVGPGPRGLRAHQPRHAAPVAAAGARALALLPRPADLRRRRRVPPLPRRVRRARRPGAAAAAADLRGLRRRTRPSCSPRPPWPSRRPPRPG